jgi:uncharacterized protein YfaQ (DUF2300 family)
MTATASTGSDTIWVCGCGQVYRADRTADGMRYWPRSGAAAYSHGLAADRPCIGCGERIRGKKPGAAPEAAAP